MSRKLELPLREAESASFLPSDGGPRGCCTTRWCIGCCCCFVATVPLSYLFIMPSIMANIGASVFLQFPPNDFIKKMTGEGYNLTNLSYKMDWPGCVPWKRGATLDRFDGDCIDDCFDREAPRQLQASIDGTPGRLVYYTSREADGIETVRLGGLLLPAERNAKEAPRIAIQHGFMQNSNNPVSFLTGLRLRELGYSVLLNNFRDHGYSDDSKNHIVEWGDAYPYDLLGAWDYLMKDPDGVLGGATAADRVGLVGFSMGGFTALNAFGLEPRIPGAWTDSPCYTPRECFLHGFFKTLKELGLESLKSDFLFDRVWGYLLAIGRSSGVDLEKNLPEKNLPMGPDTGRLLLATTNPSDQVVPSTEMQHLLDLLKTYPEKYKVSHFYTTKTCPFWPDRMSYGSHCMAIFLHPDLYGNKMCEFFRAVFKQDLSTC